MILLRKVVLEYHMVEDFISCFELSFKREGYFINAI